jgi:multicomponent Na+:H+ antiporter subunit G
MVPVEPSWVTVLSDVVAAVCLLLGGFFAFAGGAGVLRLDNLFARMHAVAKPQVLGLILLLVAVALRVRSWSAVTMLLLVVLFQLATAPVAAHMVGRAGVRTGRFEPDDLEVDELPDDYRA